MLSKKSGDIQLILQKEYQWVEHIIQERKKELLCRLPEPSKSWDELESLLNIPDLSKEKDRYSELVIRENLSTPDRLFVLLAALPLIKPSLLPQIHDIRDKLNKGESYNQIKGSIVSTNYLTAIYLIVGNYSDLWYPYFATVMKGSSLFKHRVLQRISFDEQKVKDELNLPLLLSDEFQSSLVTGEEFEPQFSSSFPAQKVMTQYNWEDLVLDEPTLEKVQSVIAWIRNMEYLTQDLQISKELKGYKSIFFGPPGTGKSLSVKVIGKVLQKSVYRVDLSTVVSKYIGETEKNLKAVFDMAEHKNWILFFDEGDALFGKRSQTKSSQDRFANQQVAYLLQRMEEFPGVVILATNKIKNLDEAFMRRFQTQVYFPVPNESIRLKFWEKAYGGNFELDDPSILQNYAQRYQISAAEIINVKHFSIVQALEKQQDKVTEEDLRKGLAIELAKSGRSL